jgi:hypothetical protein
VTTEADTTEIIMEREEVFDADRGVVVAFHGRLLSTSRSGTTGVYLTSGGRLAAYDHASCMLHVYDDFADFAGAFGSFPDDEHQTLVASVAAELGKKHVIELDI